MQSVQKYAAGAIGVLAALSALVFAFGIRNDLLNYGALSSGQRGRVWFAIGIVGIAVTLSTLVFVCKAHNEPLSSLSRVTIASLMVSLVALGGIFYSMPTPP